MRRTIVLALALALTPTAAHAANPLTQSATRGLQQHYHLTKQQVKQDLVLSARTNGIADQLKHAAGRNYTSVRIDNAQRRLVVAVAHPRRDRASIRRVIRSRGIDRYTIVRRAHPVQQKTRRGRPVDGWCTWFAYATGCQVNTAASGAGVWVGGSAIHVATGSCSAGPIGHNTGDQTNDYILTAGHCNWDANLAGTPTWTAAGYTGTAFNGWWELGIVAGTVRDTRGDVGEIQVRPVFSKYSASYSTYNDSNPDIALWDASGTQIPYYAAIRSYATPVVGAQVCHSGYASKYNCGTVTSTNAPVNEGWGTFSAVATTMCAQPGDSGGPILSLSFDGQWGNYVGVVDSTTNSGTCTLGGWGQSTVWGTLVSRAASLWGFVPYTV